MNIASKSLVMRRRKFSQRLPDASGFDDNAGGMAASTSSLMRKSLFAFAVLIALCGLWILVPGLLTAQTIGLPLSQPEAEAAQAYASRNRLAAILGMIRGDLWSQASFATANAVWFATPSKTDADQTEKLQTARDLATHALRLAPINGAQWLLLALIRDHSLDHNAASALQMSYYTAPVDFRIIPLRLAAAFKASTLDDTDLQLFIQSDLRHLLTQEPQFTPYIQTLYGAAPPERKTRLFAMIKTVDPAFAASLQETQPKPE
ncbi:hypothetical protein [Beijerinckia mobilis]|uniref:hypothetical protein n=1 Tax=Beijerinckia mobilis TaxID=231434 RepID=UPI00054FCB7B|nr:hypothetical protein [Beijerinckia mobilis]